MDKLGKPANLSTGAVDLGSSRSIRVEGNAVGAAVIAGDNNVVTIVYSAEAARWQTAPGAPEYVRQVRVFLSSPGDVVYERQLAREVAKELVAEPFFRDRAILTIMSWDNPDAPVPLLANLTPQESVNRRPKPSECDIVVVILWSRMGTPLPGKHQKPSGLRYLSGTEWEYEDALKATPQPDILLYRRTETILLDADDPHLAAKLDQRKKVKKFFKQFCNPDGSLRGGVTEYDTPTTFAERLKKDLRELAATILSRPSRLPSRDEIAVSKTVVVRPWVAPPYPGLRPFASEEAEIFFGRGREVDALLTRLRNPAQRFLAVVGASGSGKSSLLRAGLLPRLRNGIIEGSHHWRVLAFSPGDYGDNALLALASKLEAILPTRFQKPPAEIAAVLTAAPRQLLNYVGTLVADGPPGTVLVLFIDQFEELFTITAEKHRCRFLELIAQCGDDPRVRVIVTLRADFLPQCAAEPALTAQLREGTFVLGEPGPTALLDMIRKPAERAGLDLAEGLADEILRDIGSDPGALPLMAFSLEELYRRANAQRELTLLAYRDMGGVKGAIGRRAVELLEMVGKGEAADLQDVLSEVFRALVYVDAAGKAARQRANRDALLALPAPMPELIQMLIDPGRLLLAEDDGGRPTIMLAHEALLQQWPALSAWLERNRTQMQLVQRALSSLVSLEPRDRRWAVDTLREIKPMPLEVILALINVLEHQHEEARASAAKVLGGIRPMTPAIIPALICALRDEYPSVRRSVAQALGQTEPASADTVAVIVPALIAVLRDQDTSVRKTVVETLGQIGPAALAAASALEEADRDDKDPVIQGMIRVALMRIKTKRRFQKPQSRQHDRVE